MAATRLINAPEGLLEQQTGPQETGRHRRLAPYRCAVASFGRIVLGARPCATQRFPAEAVITFRAPARPLPCTRHAYLHQVCCRF